ncbi:hypothetical protein [Streptomyces sp. BE230]|uniref:hypothetical protein n=1 Tax=Streptomyces sp. BE230 TaxID=3002526 RepID=UPI002ECFF775|nr:hypothetical protein [Streptomyces sp. BE230]
MRQVGEENDYPVRPWPDFKNDPELVAEARIVAASVLDAEGLWGESMGDVQLQLMIQDMALAPERQR